MVSLITKTRPEGAIHETLRFAYEKRGALAYISHLDVLRTMTKACLRAALPLYYSEGFSPHPKLSFAAPLPVGQASVCEYFDVRLSAPMSPEAAMAALNATLPAGLTVKAAGYPARKFAEVAAAEYDIAVRTRGADAALADTLVALLSKKPLTVYKRSKAGDRDVDISPNILSVRGEFADGVIHLFVTLRAEGGAFLNTDYLLSYLKSEAGILSSDPLTEAASVVRLALLDADGNTFTEEQ